MDKKFNHLIKNLRMLDDKLSELANMKDRFWEKFFPYTIPDTITIMLEYQFKELTGENPIDVLGSDWKNHIEDYLQDSEHFHEGHLRGSCDLCKMD